jgi:hypothetical protein
MKYKLPAFIGLFIIGTIVLIPNFYRNWQNIVEPKYYKAWQTRYDRLVVARLVKTRQDGFFSAGGLLGLGNVSEWTYLTATDREQYNAYTKGFNFNSYLAYKSNPGFQGLFYGLLDKVLHLRTERKLDVFRGITALASAMVFALIFSALVYEFGILSGAFMLLFVAFSEWTILPAGSIFWSLWVFYLPFLSAIYLLFQASKSGVYNAKKIYTIIFITILAKILFSGFDLITTTFVMTSVPFIYFGVYNNWGWKLVVSRITKLGIVMLAASMLGLLILSTQIVVSAGNLASALSHISAKVEGYSLLNPNLNQGNNSKVDLSTISVIEKYLTAQAFVIRYQKHSFPILFWQLIIIFLLFTLISLLMRNTKTSPEWSKKALALTIATWYSLLAPLSWYIIFKVNAFFNPHIHSIAWQMPFTLLGLALCGLVITDIFKLSSRFTSSTGSF